MRCGKAIKKWFTVLSNYDPSVQPHKAVRISTRPRQLITKRPAACNSGNGGERTINSVAAPMEQVQTEILSSPGN